MWIDPIVQEVREAGAELAKQADYDLQTFFRNLRDNERKRKSKVISRITPPSKVIQEKLVQIK